ncbi:MAG: RNA 2',3'-cyclic phosphodiesterase [Bacteroidota bacterium]
MKRLFLAIKITPNLKLNELFQNLHDNLYYEKIKWVDLNNLHLTLKFFGETEDAKIDGICQFIENITSATSAFSFNISNIGIFGSNYNPSVIWLGCNECSELETLAEKILSELKTIGFERDRQNFVPHLSLGRINHLTDKKRFNQLIDKNNISAIQSVNVSEIFLFESVLRKEGPIYNILYSFKLKT